MHCVSWSANHQFCPSFGLNPLPNDKILDVTKWKVFAENNLNVAKMIIFLFDRVENSVGKVEKNFENKSFMAGTI